MDTVKTGPHEFQRRRGWRFWLCHHCYAPRSLHPRTTWVRARPIGDNQYLSANAPHFKDLLDDPDPMPWDEEELDRQRAQDFPVEDEERLVALDEEYEERTA